MSCRREPATCRLANRRLLAERGPICAEGRSIWLTGHLAECSLCRERAARSTRETGWFQSAIQSLPLAPDFTTDILKRAGLR